jgi:hypothetical protein
MQPQLVDSQQVIAGLNASPSALEEAALTVPFVTQPSATKELNVCPDPVAAVPLNAPLQDIYLSQHPLFVGLISILTDALQEDIAPVMAKLQLRGRAILGIGPGIASKGDIDHDHTQTCVVRGTDAAGARAVQLGGPSLGT